MYSVRYRHLSVSCRLKAQKYPKRVNHKWYGEGGVTYDFDGTYDSFMTHRYDYYYNQMGTELQTRDSNLTDQNSIFLLLHFS